LSLNSLVIQNFYLHKRVQKYFFLPILTLYKCRRPAQQIGRSPSMARHPASSYHSRTPADDSVSTDTFGIQ
jgi:hypothetical protein